MGNLFISEEMLKLLDTKLVPNEINVHFTIHLLFSSTALDARVGLGEEEEREGTFSGDVFKWEWELSSAVVVG